VPLPIWEFAGTGHVDAAAIGLLMLAFVFAQRNRVWAGIALGAATLTKFYPLVAGPAIYRRWDWKLPVAFLSTVCLLYLPYLGVGSAVFGFLPGYAAEEGLKSGGGFYLWSALQTIMRMPSDGLFYYLPLGAAIMALLAWRLQRAATQHEDRSRLSRGALLASTFTVLVSPHNPWYFAWLVPFLCFRFSVAHLWLTGACVLMYVVPDPLSVHSQSILYLPFFLLLFVQSRANREVEPPERLDAKRTHNPTAV